MSRATATTLKPIPWASTGALPAAHPVAVPVPAVASRPATAGEEPSGRIRIRTRPLRLGSVARPWEPDPRTLRSLESAAGRPLEITAGVEIADWADLLARLDQRHVVDVRLVGEAPERRVLDTVRRLADRGLAVRVHRRPGHDSESRLAAFLAAARAAGAVDVEISRPRLAFGREPERRTGLRRLRLQLGLPRVAAARG